MSTRETGTTTALTVLSHQHEEDPFEILSSANNVILRNLRRDEASPDLERQLTQTAGVSSSAQGYFCDPYHTYLGAQIRLKSFVMLPEPLVRERDRVECMSFMGLLPEIDHAWMTVDNVLFLWNYHTQDFIQFRDLEQVIVTVALIAPRRGILKETVKHVLAVATSQEVVILAVTYPDGSGSGRNRRLELRRTSFRAPTNGVCMMKICGHANGRALMAGRDGNLYELTYSVQQALTFASLGFGDSKVIKKCERRMHKPTGGENPLRVVMALFGFRDGGRTLVDVVVDSLRNVLYTLDKKGSIDLFDLGADGNKTTQKVVYFNLREAAAKFCRWATTERLPTESFFKDPKTFEVVSLDLVHPSEAKGISLVAVTNAGMRLYLSCGYSGARNNFRMDIVQIKCPPPETLWRFLRQRQASEGSGSLAQHPQDGFFPNWERNGVVGEMEPESEAATYGAYCCKGLLAMAQTLGDRERIVLLGPDMVTRSKRRRLVHQEEHPWNREAVCDVSSVAYGDPGMGRVFAIGERPVSVADNPKGARVRALLLTSPTPSQAEMRSEIDGGGGSRVSGVRTLGRGAGSGASGGALVVARSPVFNIGVIGRSAYKSYTKQFQFAMRPIAPAPPTVISPGGSSGFEGGLLPKDVGKMVTLSEFSTQLYSDKRELLLLSSSGLQVLVKLRPVDQLYDLLAEHRLDKVKLFFDDFSSEQSVAMCFSIACGLPEDMGRGIDSRGMALSYSAGVRNPTVRARALDAALTNCMPPSFAGSQGATGTGVEGVMMGEKFVNSSLHNGLQLFIARVLRPFWFRPVVTVSPPSSGGSGSKRSADGVMRRGNSGGRNQSSAVTPKVADLEFLLGPLELLRTSIHTVFPRAVSEDLAASKEARAMVRGGGGGGGGRAETPRQWQERALKREALDVHATYRLVSRAVETVRVAGVLRRAARESSGAKLPWSTLHGVPLWKLVTGKKEHSRLSSLLSDLVMGARNSSSYAQELGSSCAAFFGRGEQKAFEGVELLRGAGEAGVPQEESVKRGASLLIEAARDWRGERAVGEGGQLSRACEALAGANMLEALVDVCVACAKNFKSSKTEPPKPSLAAGGYGVGTVTLYSGRGMYGRGGDKRRDGVLEWEEGVYIGGGIVDAGEREKARVECYKKAVEALVHMLERPIATGAAAERARRSKAEGAISRILSHDDPLLHDMLFSALETSDKSLLLSLKTSSAEAYLRKDPELLYRHYMLHKNYPKAVILMDLEARGNPKAGMRVGYRVDCLVKAISACHKCNLESAQMVGPGYTLDHQKLRALEDARDVLMTQEGLLADLRRSMTPLESLKTEGRGTEELDVELGRRVKMAKEWDTDFMDTTELFQQAMKVFLWEGCLRIIKCCGANEPLIVKKLIRSIIWREVPPSSRAGSGSYVQTFLDTRSSRPEIYIDHVSRELKMDESVKFEDDGWFRPMLSKIGELMRELLTGNGRFTMPVDTVCLELETLADAFIDSGGVVMPLDVVTTLRRTSVPVTSLFSVYDIMNQNVPSTETTRKLRRLEVTVQCLRWMGEGNQTSPLGESVRPDELDKWVLNALRTLESLSFPGFEEGEADMVRMEGLKRHLRTLLESLRTLAPVAYRLGY